MVFAMFGRKIRRNDGIIPGGGTKKYAVRPIGAGRRINVILFPLLRAEFLFDDDVHFSFAAVRSAVFRVKFRSARIGAYSAHVKIRVKISSVAFGQTVVVSCVFYCLYRIRRRAERKSCAVLQSYGRLSVCDFGIKRASNGCRFPAAYIMDKIDPPPSSCICLLMQA